ncbi:MAG: ATP-binding cassette domain-containing protein, partial [Gemmatimonadales bacterium]
MTEDKKGKSSGDDRRQTPSDGQVEPGTPIRRGSDESRVREAIRSELESDLGTKTEQYEVAEKRSQAEKVIALDHVFLSFEEPILKDVTFEAIEGETIVVAGESGTGKSTILKLLLRLLVPEKGKVFIDGEEITELNFSDALKVRQKMGMV